MRKVFTAAFPEVPTATLKTNNQPKFYKKGDMSPSAVESTFKNVIGTRTIQPLPEQLNRSKGHSQSTSKLKTLRTSLERNSSGLLPRLNEKADLTAVKIASSFTISKTKIYQSEEKKKALEKIPQQSGQMTQRMLRQRKQETETKEKQEPRTQEPKTHARKSSKSQRIRHYLHFQTVEIKTSNRQQLIEEMSGRIMSNFMLEINHGRIDQNDPSFQHFQRSKAHQWQSISNALRQVQRFAIRYQIPMINIPYEKLMRICNRKVLSNRQILDAMINGDEIAENYRVAGRQYFGQEANTLAATKIQTFFRMVKARWHYYKVRILVEKVKIIQRFWKRRYQHKKTLEEIYRKSLIKLEFYYQINQKFKQEWSDIRNKNRVQIHLHNISLDQWSKLTMTSIKQRHNVMISRVFKAQDPLISIIYVVPFEMTEQIRNYYYKMFELGGMASCRDRIHFVTPEACRTFPSTLCCSRLLSYSMKAQSRIRKLVGNRPAYFVAGQPSNEDMLLSAEMRLPIFSGEVSKHRYFSTKCGSRSLFRKLNMPICKGAYDIYNMEELINTLAILIYTYPEKQRWWLKIDNEIEGRGLAIVNIQAFAAIRTFTRALVKTSIIQTQFTETEVIKAIAQELKLSLEARIKVCCPKVYQNGKTFLEAFILRGGSLEASIQNSEVLSINFLIEPTGEYKVTSCHEKISHQGRALGCMYPPKQKGQINLQHIVRSIHRYLWNEEQMYGYFTVDLLHEGENIYFIGLDCYLNCFASMVTMLQFVTGGRFDVQTGKIKKESVKTVKLNESSDSIHTMMSLPQNISQSDEVYSVYFPYFSYRGLEKCNLREFFQSCRYANISFDVKERQGTIFTLLDSVQNMGLLTSAGNLNQTLKNGKQALEMISKEYGSLTEEEGDTAQLPIIRSKLAMMMKKQERGTKQNLQSANISFLF